MSAYSASPPVMQSTTDPRTRNPRMKPWLRRKMAAWIGLIAATTPGCSSTHGRPASAMLANQTSVIGPKTAPTRAVPRR
jgi:hypothetical protein